ncbi:MAG TPA: type II toxin-antitoxin system RelB/DinJ family antitoxin [Rhizomicrobium sp.]|jgi:DNA-damage-inducible protein J|nr:type II toxin-antitoxin system RelB/DinJ family antitoxin [Rhizomicrobium sp.]
MAANAVVRARINQRLKDEASAILGAVGLTVSDAVRLMLVRTVAEKALPFDPLVPNKKTIAALKAANGGKLKRVRNIDELMADLNADD